MQCPECSSEEVIEETIFLLVGPYDRAFDVTTLYCPACDWLTFCNWKVAEDENEVTP